MKIILGLLVGLLASNCSWANTDECISQIALRIRNELEEELKTSKRNLKDSSFDEKSLTHFKNINSEVDAFDRCESDLWDSSFAESELKEAPSSLFDCVSKEKQKKKKKRCELP